MRKQPKLDSFLPYLMNRLVARMNQNLGEQLREHGFTFQNWRILAVLAAHDRITLTELTEATVIPQPSVSRNVATLVRKGLLKRRSGDHDSRFVEISITPKGRTIYKRMLAFALAEDKAAMRGVTRQQTDSVRDVLLRMMTNRNVKLLEN